MKGLVIKLLAALAIHTADPQTASPPARSLPVQLQSLQGLLDVNNPQQLVFPYLKPLRLPLNSSGTRLDWAHVHVREFRGQLADYRRGVNATPVGECLFYDSRILKGRPNSADKNLSLLNEIGRWWLSSEFGTQYHVLVLEPDTVPADAFLLRAGDVENYFKNAVEIAVTADGLDQRQVEKEVQMIKQYYQTNGTPPPAPAPLRDCLRVTEHDEHAYLVACHAPAAAADPAVGDSVRVGADGRLLMD